MDLLLWGVRAVLIVIGIILIIIIWKGKKEGRYQEYSLGFFVIGSTAFILGVILLMTLPLFIGHCELEFSRFC